MDGNILDASSQLRLASGEFHTIGSLRSGMRMAILRNVLGVLAILLLTANLAKAETIRIGVSEYVYRDLAEQIGGPTVTVTLLQHPTLRPPPHFDFVICGCARGDSWLREVAQRQPAPAAIIEASRQSMGHRAEMEFPWYDIPAMAELSQKFAVELTRRIPNQAQRITANKAHAMAAFHALDRRIDEIAKDYANSDALLADELFRGMIDRLRFKIRDEDYLNSLKLGMPPSAKSVARLKKAIQQRAGSIFLYDKDAAGPAIEGLVTLANDSGVPVVALHERPPRGLRYQQWMLRQINAVHGALNEASP